MSWGTRRDSDPMAATPAVSMLSSPSQCSLPSPVRCTNAILPCGGRRNYSAALGASPRPALLVLCFSVTWFFLCDLCASDS